MFNVNSFNSMIIGLASPEKIRSWSSGEVKKPETINYRTLKPEKEGLFCEKIFGPTRDWECHCGKYKRIRYKGVVCDRCGVEVTRSKVRRERMGHIELAAPVSHIWFFKGIPSRLGLILDMSPRSLEKVLYFVNYIVIDPGDTPLDKKQLLTESEYREARVKHGNAFQASMGAEAIKALLKSIDVQEEVKELQKESKGASGQKRKRAVRRLEVMEGLRLSGNRSEWIIMDVIPVIPPDLRPMVQLDGGRFATSDLNDLYRRVINRNNRLKRLLDLGAPEIIIRNEKRMLQEAVDALIDNGRRGRPVTGVGNRPLKSLSDMLKGKQGRFRQNLLGKRVDYSGRSVIVVGPELEMHQCGLPKKMALELFKPFVMKKLVDEGLAHNIKSAKRMVERIKSEVWDVLEDVISEHPVLLNRAPTLHRLGIQAFEPILVEGKAVKIHPLVCKPYNADFDGDQMAVHVPLSAESQTEARVLMLSTYNLLSPADGKAIIVPTQDIVLGCFYLTSMREGRKGEDKAFASPEEAVVAHENKAIDLQSRIQVRLNGQRIETTVGRIIFNEILPQEMDFLNEEMDKNILADLARKCHTRFGNKITAEVMDGIKELGFRYSTQAGLTISIDDVKIPKNKGDLIREAEKEVQETELHFRRGAITEEERYRKVVDIWSRVKSDVTASLMSSLDKFNPIHMMALSGARGNTNQIAQLGGMRGLMADPSGRIMDHPIRANFREGLTVLEYFISTHGARKGLADTALRTADSGYLTRRLVDVSQDVIVREEDCGTKDGLIVSNIMDGGEIIEHLAERITGRQTMDDILHPETGKVLVQKGETLSEELGQMVQEAGVEQVRIRSVLTCKARFGVCRYCYGRNLATGKLIDVGEAVGIIAAQSIGEPGTQLTMRTFHTGGVAGDDITQGLPRVEELFEARTPKGQAVISELSGMVHISESKTARKARIRSNDGRKKTYNISFGAQLLVKDGDQVQAGDRLTEGPVDPSDILQIRGKESVQAYLLEEVQLVYRTQGVEINDKHVEVVIRQMLRKVKVKESGDTSLLPGSFIEEQDFEEKNRKVLEEGGEPASAQPEILGITKSALATDSFLSAASFQETTRVLTEAAVMGKSDPLLGLKENVIIGQLIPAGTGMRRYRDIHVKFNGETQEVVGEEDLATIISADEELVELKEETTVKS